MTTTVIITPPPTLLVPIGPAGCGKTTLLNQVAASFNDSGMRFGNDDVRRLMYGNVTTLGPAPVVQAAAESMIAARLGQRLAISALDRTHTTRAARERSLELARANKSTCVALLSRVPLAVVLTRNAARTVVVPESVLATMYDALCDVTPETLLAEGFDTVFTFDDHTDRLVVQLRT